MARLFDRGNIIQVPLDPNRITEYRVRFQVQEEKRRLDKAFRGSKGWELEKYLGYGTFGITVLLKDSDPLLLREQRRNIRARRKVVLKWALFPHVTPLLFVHEIAALKLLRGKAHHAQIIAASTDVTKHRLVLGLRTLVKRAMAPFFNPPSNIFSILSKERGPAILLEYIEFGTLNRFLDKMREFHVTLPNRVLWSFYFCMVRACIGLNFPHDVPKAGAGRPVLETITRVEPIGFAHNDIAMRNIMIDWFDYETPEHALFPVLKFIDYGASTNVPGPQAARSNFLSISAVMCWLINPDIQPGFGPTVYNGIETTATQILPQEGNDRFPLLDPALRQLVVEGLAVREDLRPSIQDMFDRTKAGMEKDARSYYPEPRNILNPGPEDDVVIRRMFEQLLYDADSN
ncbi:hypothetical protein F5B21DRAFT_63700 [Xylaria acuta]|nr:hypothetical protein F5B21DRAFT_63700 [Xylaria acuta]